MRWLGPRGVCRAEAGGKEAEAGAGHGENQVAQNPSSGYKDVSWVPQTGHANLKGRTPGIDLERARQLLPRVVWPTRQARRMHHAQEDAQRERIEEDERNRQITKLVELLKKAELLPEDDQRVEAAGRKCLDDEEARYGKKGQYVKGSCEVGSSDA